jgi:hypothetical protein
MPPPPGADQLVKDWVDAGQKMGAALSGFFWAWNPGDSSQGIGMDDSGISGMRGIRKKRA